MAVDGGGRHAIGDVGRRNFARHNVVEQDVAQGCFAFWGVQSGEVNACVGKGLVGWSKDGERPVALEGGEQFCLDHTGHQRVVYAGALCRAWDVVGCVGGRGWARAGLPPTSTADPDHPLAAGAWSPPTRARKTASLLWSFKVKQLRSSATPAAQRAAAGRRNPRWLNSEITGEGVYYTI